MTTYENCSEDTDLTSVAILDSIFEMEQVVVILDKEGIPWQVIEHDDILMKNFSNNIGHSTLLVEVGKEEKAIAFLKKFRDENLKGHECSECELWLGPNIDTCPGCGTEQETE
ncbi:MAG: hypothetical protein PF689_13605 [Deltaproteobacteria bacterium]|jgi:hypothetical protein|nr:hypothetical protein [Deltaproteobacteria bacterium]